MPASPRDTYSPVPSVEPSSGGINDYLSVRANPTETGAQIGEATQKLGATVEQAGTQTIDYGIQALGLANEHAANMADMDLAVRGGKVYDQYKQLEGLDAANAKDKAIQDYLSVNNEIRKGLNPAAARAYDQIATRRMSYTIQDMNSYAADQTKSAYRNGNTASMNFSIDQASRVDVASDPSRFGFELGNVKFQANAMFTSPQYGKYRNIPATTQADGTLKFDDSTEEGRVAQADYNNYLNQAVGKAWENMIKTLAFDPQKGNVLNAVKTLEDNKSRIPAAMYAQLSASLNAPYRSAQSKTIADDVWNDVQSDYNNSLGPTTPGTSPAGLTDVFINQESSGGKTSPNLGQIQPGTWSEFARPGEDINNPKDNRAVTQRVLQKYSQDYGGDLGRIATAYFSGPSNVSPVGSQTPYLNDTKDANGKSVSQYVSDIERRAGSGTTGYQSMADYLRVNYDTLVQQARDKANLVDPGNVVLADQAVAQTEAQINNVIRTQELSVRAAQDHISQVVLGDDNHEPVTSPKQLSQNPDPRVREDWNTLQLNNPLAAQQLINNVLTSNARGVSNGYGSDFYNIYADVISGKVTDQSQLYGYVKPEAGKDSPLTNTGLKVLAKTLNVRNTPEGVAFLQAEGNFFKSVRGQITGTGVTPGAFDPVGDQQFVKFMAQALPAIEAGKSQGKTAAELFDPKSPDYVGRFVATFQRTPSQIISGLAKQSISPSQVYGGANPQSNQPTSYNSLSDIQKAYHDGKISKQAAVQYSLSKGWIQPAPPQVPLPQ